MDTIYRRINKTQPTGETNTTNGRRSVVNDRSEAYRDVDESCYWADKKNDIYAGHKAALEKTSPTQRLEMINAAFVGDIVKVDSFLSAGYPACFGGPAGLTPLMYAAQNGHEKIVAKLLEAGAYLSAEDDSGCTALFWAIRSGQPATARHLYDAHSPHAYLGRWNNLSPLQLAAKVGSVLVVRELLDAGVDISGIDNWSVSQQELYTDDGRYTEAYFESCTALHVASMADSVEVANLLLDRGAEIDRLNNGKMTPLFETAHHRAVRVMNVLVDRGANTEVKMENGFTADDVFTYGHKESFDGTRARCSSAGWTRRFIF